MIELNGIRNIVLDLGGVILGLDVNKSIELLSGLGFPGEENLDVIFSKHPYFLQYEIGKITTDQFIEAISTQLGNHTPGEKILEAWNAMILGFRPGTIELIMNLRERYRMFLLSNTNASHEIYYNELLRAEYDIPNLKDIFEKVYYSHDVKMRKPNHEIFQFVLENSRLIASETLYIDDTEKHVKAASDLGILGFHLILPQSLTEVL